MGLFPRTLSNLPKGERDVIKIKKSEKAKVIRKLKRLGVTHKRIGSVFVAIDFTTVPKNIKLSKLLEQ